jgi:hypothetical protein
MRATERALYRLEHKEEIEAREKKRLAEKSARKVACYAARREKSAAYYAAHKEERRAYNIAHKERDCAYRKEHLDEYIARLALSRLSKKSGVRLSTRDLDDATWFSLVALKKIERVQREAKKAKSIPGISKDRVAYSAAYYAAHKKEISERRAAWYKLKKAKSIPGGVAKPADSPKAMEV